MMRKILLACLLLAGHTAVAQQGQPERFQEGKDYYRLDQAQAPVESDTVEVTVVFSYMCNHCNALEPYLQNWEQTKPDNVKVNRVHVSWGNRAIQMMARGYITAEMTGIADESHAAMMDAIWKEGKRFRSPEELAGFYEQFGVDKERFLANYNSFAADSQLRRSVRDVQTFGVTGTPAIIVNRKYRIPNSGQVTDVIDFLVVKETAGTQAES